MKLNLFRSKYKIILIRAHFNLNWFQLNMNKKLERLWKVIA